MENKTILFVSHSGVPDSAIQTVKEEFSNVSTESFISNLNLKNKFDIVVFDPAYWLIGNNEYGAYETFQKIKETQPQAEVIVYTDLPQNEFVLGDENFEYVQSNSTIYDDGFLTTLQNKGCVPV